MEVARLLWELGQASVRQVYEAFPPDRDIDFTTVQTYLRRLHTKGYVRTWLDGRSRTYAPSVKPKTVIRETVNDLVDRLFGGETVPLMRHLIEERGIGEEELDGLRRLLDQLEEKERPQEEWSGLCELDKEVTGKVHGGAGQRWHW
jgi:predicted transcriptional regulator